MINWSINMHMYNNLLCWLSPVGCPEILVSLISQCNRIQSEDRPTFTEILECCNIKDLPTIVEHSSTVLEQSFQI